MPACLPWTNKFAQINLERICQYGLAAQLGPHAHPLSFMPILHMTCKTSHDYHNFSQRRGQSRHEWLGDQRRVPGRRDTGWYSAIVPVGVCWTHWKVSYVFLSCVRVRVHVYMLWVRNKHRFPSSINQRQWQPSVPLCCSDVILESQTQVLPELLTPSDDDTSQRLVNKVVSNFLLNKRVLASGRHPPGLLSLL